MTDAPLYTSINERLFHAQNLMKSATETAAALFASGDLCPYLSVLQRMSEQNAYNLLLILEQNPQATCIASINEWKRLSSDDFSDKRVIKDFDQRTKPLHLLFPICIRGQLIHFDWYAVECFDVSQTTTAFHLPPPIYIHDKLHEYLLVKSASNVLRREYHCTVYKKTPDMTMRKTDTIGHMHDRIISFRDDAKPIDKLTWLVDCLCSLQDGIAGVPSAYHDLFNQCIKHALLIRWALEIPPSLLSYGNIIRSLPESFQLSFLNTLQHTYRSIEESMAYTYVALRKELSDHLLIKTLDAEYILSASTEFQ